jgi:hypothetical protein
VCHLDDALQAPPNHEHFDGYRQGAKTETVYAPYTHIPGLNRGGWHDAGDYDLATGSQAWATLLLALIREAFGVDVDQTTVRQDKRLVVLHTPDGVPDIVQQVAHGVENLLTGYQVVGHSFSGIIAGTVEQYVHLGDACNMTDNLVYDPELGPDIVAEGRSGKRDDRWVFTSHDTSLEYLVTTALAAASRVLRDYEDELADECLETAINTWQREQSQEPVEQPSAYIPGQPAVMEALAAVELLITTGQKAYRQRLLALWPIIQENLPHVGGSIARALPYIKNDAFTAKFRSSLQNYKTTLETELSKNPFGIPYQENIWGVGWLLQRYAVQQYYLAQAFPDLFERENVLCVVNYVLGCHPASNVSLVSGVGARSETIAYGINRADWSYIPGGNISGVALIKPDFPELKESFPFIWQQTEYVISGAATYIFCVLAADKLLNA